MAEGGIDKDKVLTRNLKRNIIKVIKQLRRRNNMNANVIVSEETMAKNKESSREINRMRMKRLKEISDNGKLTLCRNRCEVAKAMGFIGQHCESGGRGYQWVGQMIRKNKLEEQFRGIGQHGAEYEYYLRYSDVPEAQTSKTRVAKKSKRQHREHIKMPTVAKNIEVQEVHEVREEQKEETLTQTMHINIDKENMKLSIEIDNVDPVFVATIIKTLTEVESGTRA